VCAGRPVCACARAVCVEGGPDSIIEAAVLPWRPLQAKTRGQARRVSVRPSHRRRHVNQSDAAQRGGAAARVQTALRGLRRFVLTRGAASGARGCCSAWTNTRLWICRTVSRRRGRRVRARMHGSHERTAAETGCLSPGEKRWSCRPHLARISKLGDAPAPLLIRYALFDNEPTEEMKTPAYVRGLLEQLQGLGPLAELALPVAQTENAVCAKSECNRGAGGPLLARGFAELVDGARNVRRAFCVCLVPFLNGPWRGRVAGRGQKWLCAGRCC